MFALKMWRWKVNLRNSECVFTQISLVSGYNQEHEGSNPDNWAQTADKIKSSLDHS